MNDLTRDSDNIVRAAKESLSQQRAGGVHRRAGSIGRGSAKLKAKHWGKKARNIVIAVFAIWLASGIAGAMFSGIGFWGLMAVLVASIVAIGVFSSYPKMEVPKRADLKTENVRDLVGKTELWLEMQRSKLPKPIAKSLAIIGSQLDELQRQLEDVDQKHPTAREIRKLVGEDMPDMIEGFLKIPESMRYEERSGTTPVKQLENGLDVISREIDSINRQLAQGSIDDLAIKNRYLDYKYGEGAETSLSDTGVPLPDFDLDKQKAPN
ncbi:hypothetical protein K3163_02975 [Qipengyuania sp. 1NDW9]|uniref:hypothetical protein n=1 Tax=Qipengyuania xiapuensis TaxID=2867236 RepID=UPI001C869AF7|nr:hypothetical protein [Qipengyuania xiapuensis]MBX7492170.1 hypothetical protein [Qipengyuania xiapuensis]